MPTPLNLESKTACLLALLLSVASGCAGDELPEAPADAVVGDSVESAAASPDPTPIVADTNPAAGEVIGTGVVPTPPTTTPPLLVDPTARAEAEGATTGGVTQACASSSTGSARVTSNAYYLVDASGSMDALVADDITRWDAVTGALREFFGSADTARMNAALSFFPIQEPRTACRTADDCFDGAPCFRRFCAEPFVLTGLGVPCESDRECRNFAVRDPLCFSFGVCDNDNTRPCVADDLTCDLDLCPSDECRNGGRCIRSDKRPAAEVGTGFCPGASSCELVDYEQPEIGLSVLSDNTMNFVGALDARLPDDYAQTPTHLAASGAINQAAEWRSQDPATPAFVVLVTDGLPGSCDSSSELVLAALADGLQRGIQTLVIGVVDDQPGSQEFRTRLNEWAVAGGQKNAFFVNADGTAAEGFKEALNEILGQLLPCSFPIPAPPGGQELDFDRVNVELSRGDEMVTVPQVDGAAQCPEEGLAWYYSERLVDPMLPPERQIALCASTCEEEQGQGANGISVVLGCETVRTRVR